MVSQRCCGRTDRKKNTPEDAGENKLDGNLTFMVPIAASSAESPQTRKL